MARGNIKVGDEVAVTAVVRGRVTPDRISVTIPSYDFPHSVVDSTSKAVIGQHMELTGKVTRVDGDTGDRQPPAIGDCRRRACSPGRELRRAKAEESTCR
ncbi:MULTISPECIES: hypothetical protein [unclassified Mesorhizobium]|uniref:hypothetical protein n=1 Tax=unclassified Mesorhizobium TaxID=325217 RepID=UPI003335C24B